ncbi:SNARE associated Golgi protein family [Hibiscus syriacus]|uniref:SNARE associated Golgi protein family n=1 Tax=Hibiscus syriacus TaxID=106335 RepID=A0A6A3C349_HIBSY|nr:SNARE associated Golgi protein family [Hibiscus syriacus]
MGKKKSKEPVTVAVSDTVAAQSDAFKTIFGDVSQPDTAVSSLFSDDNPFKRKSIESVEDHKNDGSLVSGAPPLKRGKRKEKEEGEIPTFGSSEEGTEAHKSKKGRNPENLNLGSLDNFESSGLDAKRKLSEEKKEAPESLKGLKKNKRKREEVEKEYEERKYGAVAVESDAEEKVVVGQKRKKPEDVRVVASVPKEGFDDESKLLRTVFVGNLPIQVKKKVLIKEFSKFGEIESVRIRSVPLNDTKKPRKGAVMLKQINDKADSVHAYVVFKTEQSAEESLANNMAVIAGNHIRVDRACPPRKKLKAESAPLYDNKRTVFLGNLPFDVKDEEVYQLFCGINNLESNIEAVRVIRDPQFGVGKGIAYVLFKTREAANSVVKKRTLKLRDRELRLSHAKPDATPSKRKNQSSSGDSTPAKKLAVGSSTSSTNDHRSNKKLLCHTRACALANQVARRRQFVQRALLAL